MRRPDTLEALLRIPRLRVIVLERTNHFEAVRSLEQAQATGPWQSFTSKGEVRTVGPQVRLDPQFCAQRFRTAEAFYSKLRETCPPERTHWVYYDQLRDDSGGVIAHLAFPPRSGAPGRAASSGASGEQAH